VVVMYGREPRDTAAARLRGMSRRRRILGIAVALIVVAGVAGAAVAATQHGGGPAGPGGAGGPARASGPPQNRPGPVLLVPGYGGSTDALDVLASRIRASGRQATVLRLPGSGTGSLVADARLLNSAVSSALAHGAPSVDVVGYSAGGVVAMIWARRDDGFAKARRIVTLGSPFHGTQLAAAAEAIDPSACPAACEQLIPGSSLLDSLDVASPAGLPRWESLWTTNDMVVTPPDSASLPGAVDVPIQSVCPAVRLTHSQLPTSQVVMSMVIQALGSGPLRHPSAAVCS
jgi:triacylglycerol lipase